MTDLIWREKVLKFVVDREAPNSAAVRIGVANLHAHLAYIGYLFEQRNWLAGDRISLADIAAGAQLSVLDYLGDVPWEAHPAAKLWYARLKSRPSFRPLLADRVPASSPPPTTTIWTSEPPNGDRLVEASQRFVSNHEVADLAITDGAASECHQRA